MEVTKVPIPAMRHPRLAMEAIAGMDLPEWGQIAAQTERVALSSGETLAAPGDSDPYIYFLTAGLLTAEPLKLGNVPHLKDISTMLALLGHMGVRVTLDDRNHVTLCGESIPHKEAPYEMVKTMRASVLALGPLLARFGEATVSLPGGDLFIRWHENDHVYMKGSAALVFTGTLELADEG